MKNFIFIALAMLVFASCGKEELVLDDTAAVMEKAAPPPPCCVGLNITTAIIGGSNQLHITADMVSTPSHFKIAIFEVVAGGPDISYGSFTIPISNSTCGPKGNYISTSNFATSGKPYRAEAEIINGGVRCGTNSVALWTQP